MNKPIIAVLAALAVFTSTTGVAYAQYGGTGATGGSTGTASPEQLQECEQLGILRENCSDVTILAKKRLTAANETHLLVQGHQCLQLKQAKWQYLLEFWLPSLVA